VPDGYLHGWDSRKREIGRSNLKGLRLCDKAAVGESPISARRRHSVVHSDDKVGAGPLAVIHSVLECEVHASVCGIPPPDAIPELHLRSDSVAHVGETCVVGHAYGLKESKMNTQPLVLLW
jgi:hypothetical protein